MQTHRSWPAYARGKAGYFGNFFRKMADDDAAEPDVALAAWFPEGASEPVRFPDHPS